MSKIQVLTPPVLHGNTETQLRTLRSYLYQMSQQLTEALEQLDGDNFVPESPLRTAASASALQEEARTRTEEAASLKALILRSAETVEEELRRVETALTESCVARSEFGTYQEAVDTRFAASALSVEQVMGYWSQVSDALSSFETQTSGTIRSGIVDFDGNVPVYGVAVGQNITVTEKTVGGVTYGDVIVKEQFQSVFTASELSFYQGDSKVAYLSNRQLYITDAVITGRLTLGNWRLDAENGFTIRWIGA